MLDRKVCLDGSGFDQDNPSLARAGWGLVSVSLGGHIVAPAYGPLPHVIQLAGAGEVYAFLMALKLAGPEGLEAITDCKVLEDVWVSGPSRT